MSQITRFRGDTVPDRITVQVNGVPVDITGYQFRLTVNPSRDPADDTAQLFQVVGVIIAPATDGVVEFAPTPVQADQVPGVYFYDIEQVDTAGRVKTIMKDVYIFEQDITKVN